MRIYLRRLLKAAIPFLKHGIDSAVVYIGSKNVPATELDAGAYSVAKAGLTQLSRVAALELGQFGTNVNVIHPNMVFDTAIWTDEVLQERAVRYNMSVEEYKTDNLLKTEVTSWNVTELTVSMVWAQRLLKLQAHRSPLMGEMNVSFER